MFMLFRKSYIHLRVWGVGVLWRATHNTIIQLISYIKGWIDGRYKKKIFNQSVISEVGLMGGNHPHLENSAALLAVGR